MIPSVVFVSAVALKKNFLLCSKFSRIPRMMPKVYTRVLSISGMCMAGFFVKSFGRCYGSTVMTGTSCWPSTSIPDHKIVSALEVKSQLFSFVVRLRQWCVLPPLCLYQGPLHNGSRAKSDLWSRPVTRGANPPKTNFHPPWKKCVAHSLKLLDTVQKI